MYPMIQFQGFEEIMRCICSLQKGRGTLLVWKNEKEQFQGVRKSQGIGFSRSAFLSLPSRVLPDGNGISERVKEKDLGGGWSKLIFQKCSVWLLAIQI